MLIEEADHEVKKVMDDTGKVKELIVFLPRLLQLRNLRLHLNLEHFETGKAFAEDKSCEL